MEENKVIELYRRLLNSPSGLYRFINNFCNMQISKHNDLKSFLVNSIIMMFKNTYFSIHISIKYVDDNINNNILRRSINTVISDIKTTDELSYCLDGTIYMNIDTNSGISLSSLNREELILLLEIISKDNRLTFFNTIENSGHAMVYKDCKFNKEIIEKHEDCFYIIEYFIFSLIYYQIFLYVSEINNNDIIYSCVRSLCDIIISAMNTIRYIDTKYSHRYNNLVFWLSKSKTEDIIKIVSEWAISNIIPFVK